MDIIFQANKDAYKMWNEIRLVDLTGKNGEFVKAVARQQAREKYPRGTKQERGLFAHQFYRKIRYYEIQSLHDEWSRDAGF